MLRSYVSGFVVLLATQLVACVSMRPAETPTPREERASRDECDNRDWWQRFAGVTGGIALGISATGGAVATFGKDDKTQTAGAGLAASTVLSAAALFLIRENYMRSYRNGGCLESYGGAPAAKKD